MSTLKEKITELNHLVVSGRMLEAFEKFYHPEVVMQENEGIATIGKDANRLREEDFLSKATGFEKNARAEHIAIGDAITMVKWRYNYEHAEWGNKNYTQISIQHWQDGLIIKEQFFYSN